MRVCICLKGMNHKEETKNTKKWNFSFSVKHFKQITQHAKKNTLHNEASVLLIKENNEASINPEAS